MLHHKLLNFLILHKQNQHDLGYQLNEKYNPHYDIYINDSNKDSVKYLFLDDYNNQLKLNKDITDCLYTMDDKTYDLYLHEIELKNKLW